MNNPAKLTPAQIECLVHVYRRASTGEARPATIKALEAQGLIRHTHNEFIFTFNGGSSNSGYVLTEAGENTIGGYLPASVATVIAALKEIKAPSLLQQQVLRRLVFWGRTEITGRLVSISPVKAKEA